MYRMQNADAVNMLEHLATSLEFMTPELEQYIARQREYLRPRTPAELRREFDNLRRKRHTENECLRGVDEMDADRGEELRVLLLAVYPYVMGDYIEGHGGMEFSGCRSDVWCYYDRNGGYTYYEIWREYIEQGVIVECKELPRGEVVTLRCGTSYEVAA